MLPVYWGDASPAFPAKSLALLVVPSRVPVPKVEVSDPKNIKSKVPFLEPGNSNIGHADSGY